MFKQAASNLYSMLTCMIDWAGCASLLADGAVPFTVPVFPMKRS
jgi:hypothetical protein